MKVNTYKSYKSITINEEAPKMGCFAWVLKPQAVSCLTCNNTNAAGSGSACMGCGEYASWEAQQVIGKAS
jgi:hypothetical protein